MWHKIGRKKQLGVMRELVIVSYGNLILYIYINKKKGSL